MRMYKWLPKPNYDGPKGPLARYAFGYTDKKPGLSFWLIHIAMVAFVLYHMFEIRIG